MTEATKTIENSLSVESIRRGTPWRYFDDFQEKYTAVTATLGRECRDWAEGETDRAVEAIIAEQSREGDAVIFTDGSVQRGIKSGWAYTVRVNGETVAEGSGAVDITTSSMLMEVKAVTEALRYLQANQLKRAIIVTDSMSTLQKISKEYLYADWVTIISSSSIEHLSWIFSPGHAGVTGNERADSLAGEAVIDNNITIDPPTVVQCVSDQLIASRPQSSSYTLSRLKEKGVQLGDGATCNRRGVARRRQNQLLMETLSLQTLRASLMTRDEQAWACPACYDSDVGDRY